MKCLRSQVIKIYKVQNLYLSKTFYRLYTYNDGTVLWIRNLRNKNTFPLKFSIFCYKKILYYLTLLYILISWQ